jgi:translocation and assembly module TamB
MRKRRPARVGRWIARVLCILFALIGLLPVLAGVLLRTEMARTWASEQARSLLHEETGLDGSFHASVRPWPLTIVVDNLEIQATDEAGPALTVDQLTLRPQLFSLLQGRMNAGDIEVERPHVRLVVRDGKVTNLDLHTRPRDDAPQPVKRAPFSSLAVNDAHLDVTVDDLRVSGREIDIDVSASEGPVFDLAVRTGRVHVDSRGRLAFTGYGAPDPVDARHEDSVCELDARVRVEPDAVLIRRIRLSGVADLDPELDTRPSCLLPGKDPRRVELELRLVRAVLDDEGPASVAGHVRARTPLRLANRFFEFLPLQGWVATQVDGAWHRGQKLPDVWGAVQGEGIALGIYRIASVLSAKARIDAGVLRVPEAQVGFADGMVKIKDAEVRPLAEGIPLRASRLDIGGIKFPGLMRDLGVTDHTHVRMDFQEGSLSAVEGTIDPLRIDSDLRTQVRDFEVFDAAFDDPSRKHVIGVRQGTVRSKFAIRPHAVEFQNGRAEFGGSHLNVFTSLGFANEFRLVVSKGSRVDLDDVNPLLDIPWKGKADLTVDITGVFNDPLIQGDLAIEGFEFAEMALGDIQRGKVQFRPMIMDISDVQGVKGYSAYHVPSMRVDFTGPAPVMADAQIRSSAFDIRDFLSIFHFEKDPRYQDIHGVAAANAQLHYEQGGPLDRCGGGWLGVQVDGSLRQLDLFEEKYDGGTFELDYEWFDRDAQELGIRADIRTFVLRKGEGTIVGQGTIRPGGVLRARAAVSNLPVAELDALGALGPLLDARISATADVRGTLDRIEADVDTRIGPLRLGTAILPPSRLSVRLVPVDPPVRVIGRTRCGLPVGAPFDPVAFAKDTPTGVFEVRGELFGGQVVVQDRHVTQQTHMVEPGTIVARALDLGKVVQIWPTMAGSEDIPKGVLSGALDMRHLPLDALHRADLSLVLTALEVQSGTGSVRLRQGTPPITLQRDELTVPGILLDFQSPKGISGTFLAGGQVHHMTSAPELDLHAQLTPTDLSALANVVPRIERARGVVEASLDVTGSWQSPLYRGQASLRDGALSVTGVPMPIDDIDVLVRIDERQIQLERANARLGGGRITAVGTLPVEGFDFGTASATITARDLHLAVVDGVKMTVDADLTASWNARLMQETGNIPRVVGDVRLLAFEYTRPFRMEADISSLAERARRTSFELYDPSQDMVDFEVRIHAPRPLRIRNNLADMKLSLDSPVLTLSGSNQRVGLRGALRVQSGSRVRLRANEFEVRDGLVRFDDMTRIAPNLDVTAVTEYRRYSGTADTAPAAGASGVSRAGGQWRIQMHAHGDTDNLRLDLTSEPALSQEDIILLLTLGVTRAELDQMQASSLGETAALEAISTLTGADSVVRESLPVIDDFRFGSAYSSRSGRTEPTVTVGKRVTERVRANVTSGLSDTREVRSNLEWQLTGASSILGSWDNVNNVSNSSLGNLGADVRFRISFE